MTYLLLNSKIVPRFTTIYFIVTGTKKLFKTRYLLWFISQKDTNNATSKKTKPTSCHHFTANYQARIYTNRSFCPALIDLV